MGLEGVEIIDNFLPEEEFRQIQSIFLGQEIPWFWTDGVVLADDEYAQLVHMIYFHGGVSEYLDAVSPLLQKIDPLSLIRVKANLLPREREITVHGYHTDLQDGTREGVVTTAVFYLNTNNGYTIFEDGTKVSSVENRFVMFPHEMMHSGTSCTDSDRRVVLNFNFIKNS